MKKTAYVDPMIGTVGDEQQTSFHGGGKTHPGACYPFGMVQLSPDTTTSGDNGTGYNYCQNTIEGFSFNHMSGIGWYGDLGNLQIMPIVGDTDLRSGSNAEHSFLRGREGWRSPFSHENERAAPGYYSVLLDRYGILCEATVSEHTGQLRFTYPAHEKSGMILNFSRRIGGRSARQEIEIDHNFIYGSIVCDHRYGGFGRGKGGIDYTLYFCLELSKPIEDAVFFANEEFYERGIRRLTGEDLHLLIRYNTCKDEQVLVRCGISYTDLDGAKRNLMGECPAFDFDGTYQRTDAVWEEALSCVFADASSSTDLTLFYTCLYHTLLDPRTATDLDGRYRDARGNIKHTNKKQRTMFSGWDVYRSEFPLLTLITPRAVGEEIDSLLNIARTKNTSLPIWELMGHDSGCMTGDPGVIVMADAYLKGIRDFDIDEAYEIAMASARSQGELHEMPFKGTRPTSEQYRISAYKVADLSSTLEFLLADYALAQLALSLGKGEDHAWLSKRADTYGENYDPALGFMAPRDESGRFLCVRDEYDTLGCIESNIYQQSMFVPYDVDGLARLFGKQRLIDLLERLFERADLGALWNENYNHSNEPCHNLTHYFSILGLPRRTQYWTRRVQKEAYRTGAFGFCGNEDVGQLSAWYVLSAMGLAQVCMATDRFYLNTPLLQRVKLKLDRKYHACTVSDFFVMECDKDPQEYPYIEEIILNGERIDRCYLSYREITDGAQVQLILTRDEAFAEG